MLEYSVYAAGRQVADVRDQTRFLRLTNSGFGVQLCPSYETVSIKKGGGRMTKVYRVRVVGLGAGLARCPVLEGWGA